MKKRNNKIIVLITAIVIFVVALLIFILNYSKDDTSYSLLEKKWLNDNTNNVIDVSVYNDISVFGYAGDGIIFDYLSDFTDLYDINFNKVSYLTSNDNITYKDIAFKILNIDTPLSDNDILLYSDKYVIVSKDSNTIDKITDINSISLGVFNEDLALASYYLTDATNISYKNYSDIDTMLNALDNGEVTHLLLPFNFYLDKILSNNLNIVYHLSDINRKYVLTVNDNKTLLSILKKYTIKYLDESYEEEYKKNFTSLFFKLKNISEEEQMSYNANSYVYGYVSNYPFEVKEDDQFTGIIANYLSGFEDLFDVDFKTVRYDNITSLKNALSSGEVDVIFGNFSTSGVNVDRIMTNSPFKEEYVVLSMDSIYLDSIRSLKDKEVNVVASSFLSDYLTRNGAVSNGCDNSTELIRKANPKSILIMDKDTYLYYKDGKLSNYNIIYEGTLNNEYNFVIRKVNKNTTFAVLFNFYVSMIDYNDIKYNNNISKSYLTTSLSQILKYSIIIIITLLIVFGIIFILKKRKKKEKIIKKDEKLKFIDAMTSLKNRNYLNYNMEKWEENVIYPQSFVVIDLNNIKSINDNHGHEEGDNVITKAAGILIVNQLENTDIMRTDGNEFLIYMVGYSEKEVISYTRKISKELKELPYGYGASIGYSMITDDVKTIDDAINEATLEMRKAKENEKTQ